MFTPTHPQLAAFGAVLRAMREGCGLSVTELAERCGTNKSTISRLERGQRTVSADLLANLTRAIADKIAENRGQAA